MERLLAAVAILIVLPSLGRLSPSLSLVNAQVGRTAAEWYDSESSGSSGGYSGGDTSGEVECRMPSGVPELPALFESDVVREIRCHVSCIEAVADQEDVTIEVAQDLQVWPTVSDGTLEQNCSVYQKVQECRSGCLIHSSAPGITIKRCAAVCLRNCVADCSEEVTCKQLESTCNQTCSKPACELGCAVFEQVFSDPNGQPPLSPDGAPDLSQPEELNTAGVYSIDLFRAAPVTNTFREASLTSFLFRVLHPETNLIGHFWLHSLDDVLRLEAFACLDDVLVQFQAVNKYGATEWSPYSFLTVYGDSSPLVPEHPLLQFTFEPDVRFGYWKHALVTVYWERPRGVEYLGYYKLQVLPTTVQCGNALGKEINISRDSTSTVLQAGYLRDAPINGCNYQILVASVAASSEDIEPPQIVTFQVDVDNPVPLNYTCSREWNEISGTFQFTASWSVPNLRELREAIHHFSIIVKLVSPVILGGYRIHDNEEIPFDKNVLKYSHTTLPVAFHASGSYYIVQLQSFAAYNDVILIPAIKSCEFDAMPIPFDPIQDISITSELYTSVDVANGVAALELSAAWSAPSSSSGSGGIVSVYQLRLVEVAARGEEGSAGDVYAFKEVGGSSPRAAIAAEVPAMEEDGGCAYLQLRSVSVHGAVSNWSQPVCISLPSSSSSSSSSVTTAPSISTEPSTPSTRVLSLPVVYAIAAVGTVLTLAILILSVFVCVACTRAKREKTLLAETISPSVKMSAFLDMKTSQSGPLGDFPSSSSPIKVMGGWELHPSQLVIDGNLGDGAFGPVYRGTVRDGMGPHQMKNPDSMTVSIKLLRTTCSLKERQIFLQQIAQAKLVSASSHVHIVNMVGCVTLNEPLCLVSELPEGGDLLSFLITARIEGSVYSLKERLKADDLLTFAAQILSGMEYLSAIGVVHGDLACRNVYLGAENIAKVCDFSLGRRNAEREGAYVWTPAGRLPLRWMALEALTQGAFSNASDVWSYGVTLWEIATLGGFPYPTISNMDLLAAVQSGHRMEQPSNCSAQLYKLMSQCWRDDPSERPSFMLLQEHLQEMLASGRAERELCTELDHSRPYYYTHNSSSLSGTSGLANTSFPSSSSSSSSSSSAVAAAVGQRRDEACPGLNTLLYSDSVLPRIVEDEHEDMTEDDETTTVAMETPESSENSSECTSTASEAPETAQTSLDSRQTSSEDGLIQSDGSDTPDKPTTLEGTE